MKPVDYVSGLNEMYQSQPHDVDLQTRILEDALSILVTARNPGNIVDLQYEWDEPFDFPGFLRDMQDMLREEESTLQEWKPEV